MIHLCPCTKGSSATLYSHPGSKACKYCGGNLAVNGLGALAGNMLSSEGLDLINPQLNWKTATKGRQRAARKARTSFSIENKKRSYLKNSKEITDATDKESQRMDIPVSESEKVGVSILGRRFSNSLENIPIKKRKFLLVRSPSPPPQFSESKDSDNLFTSEGIACQESIITKRTSIRGTTELRCDAADFSGISILAAAACNSDLGVDLINVGTLVSQGQSQRVASLVETCQGTETGPIGEELSGRCNNSTKACSTSVPEIKQTNARIVCSSETKNPSDSSQTDSEKVKSRDSRLHWDLNTVMDVWDSACDDVNSEPSVIGLAVENGDAISSRLEASPSMQAESDFGGCLPELYTSKEHGTAIAKPIVIGLCSDGLSSAEICNDNAIADGKKGCSGNGNDPNTVEASTALSDSAIESKIESNEQKSRLISSVPEVCTFLNGPLVNEIEEKVSMDSGPGLVTKDELASFHVPLVEDINCSNERNEHFICRNSSSLEVSIESKKTMKEDIERNSADCPNDTSSEHANLCSFQVEKEEDVITDVLERACTSSDKIMCRNLVNSPSTSIINPVISDEFAACHGDNNDKTCGDIHTEQRNRGKSANHVELISGGVSTDNQNDTEQKANQSKCGNSVDDKLTCLKNDDNCAHISSEDLFPTLIGPAPVKPDSISLGHKVCNEGAGEKQADTCVDSSKDFATDVQLKCNSVETASQFYDSQVNGMEKLDLLGDDDSQYEDGEFRESILYNWGDEGGEETEQLDYGSDNRENDTFEIASVSAFYPADSLTSRKEDISLPVSDGSHTQKDRQAVGSMPLSKCSSTSQDFDAVSWKRNPGIANKEAHKENFGENEIRGSVDTLLCDDDDKLTGYMALQRSDYNKESSASLRTKMSGWDKLPEGRRCLREDDLLNAGFDTIRQDRNPLDISGSDTLRSKSAWRRDLSYQVERPKSLDESCRSDRSYIRSVRPDDHRDQSPKSQREAIASGRGGSSHYGQGRGRADFWIDSSNHGRARHHDSSGYYGAPTFSQPNARNAAAAAVAKVESNGFVVAPDGTLVKAAGAGSANRLPRRSANASTQSPRSSLPGRGSPTEGDRLCGVPRTLGHSREFSPGRHFSVSRGQAARYGNEVARERYRRNMMNGPMDMSPATHQLPRRDRSISPHRVPLNLSRSRTRSQSRSRTRSPQRWTSPRGRFDAAMNGVRRRSRSPNFKMESRMGRMQPRQRPNFPDRIGGYGPLSRIHASPPHGSRWVDERNDSPDRLREQEYKRNPRRSPNMRGMRNHRFDPEDPHGRLKHDDCLRQLRPSRVPEYVGFDRGFKHDGDGRGGRDERYELVHTVKHYDADNNMKRLHYDVGSNFHTGPGVKSTGFQRRGSPGGFDRGMPRQIGDSPRRDHVAKVHF